MIVLMSASLLALDGMDRQRRRTERSSYFDATHDPLTGLPNRRMFAEIAEIDLTRATREGTVTSVVMLDIDHFKLINDEFGHPAGDVVLKGTSAIIKNNLRGGDLAARLGGEEFAILLPDTPADAAIGLTKRLLRQVERIDFSATLGPARPVTISAGVACQRDGAERLDALLAAADAALYAAKDNGRNRVELAEVRPA